MAEKNDKSEGESLIYKQDDGSIAVWLTADFEPVPKNDPRAVMIKVINPKTGASKFLVAHAKPADK